MLQLATRFSKVVDLPFRLGLDMHKKQEIELQSELQMKRIS